MRNRKGNEVRTILFLCSGNYYRSRFAELLFNAHAAQERLPWQAQSRGFFIHGGNVGPISPYVVEGLRSRGVAVAGEMRFPLVVTERDLEASHHIVAVKESEHRPKLEANFPSWTSRVEFWTIDDIDCADPWTALAQLEGAVLQLANRLAMSRMPA
jgi:protein-tyrosine phosphatase